MNHKKLLLAAVLLLAGVLLLAACSNQEPPALEGAARDQVLAYAGPISDNLLQGLADKDYPAFSRDFDETMLSKMGEAEFTSMLGQLDTQLGSYQSHEFDRVVDFGNFVTVYYKGKFTKSASAQILVSINKNEPHKVSGLYFR